jgi:hypothetical protein
MPSIKWSSFLIGALAIFLVMWYMNKKKATA